MSRTSIVVATGLLLVVIHGACTSQSRTCGSDGDCNRGEHCIDGSCAEQQGCSSDADCFNGQRCDTDSSTCVALGQACTSSLDCDADQMCDAVRTVCVPLPAGSCRNPTQCSGATPHCLVNPPMVGTCVECTASEHCTGGQLCSTSGTCGAGQSSSGSAGSSHASSVMASSSLCSNAVRNACINMGGTFNESTCSCGGAMGSSGGGGTCMASVNDRQACGDFGGVVDEGTCRCKYEGSGDMGCTMMQVEFMTALCQGLGASLSTCSCGGGGMSSGGGGNTVCTDDCGDAFDGLCDDGGPGALDASCTYGSDCNDCGPRTMRSGSSSSM